MEHVLAILSTLQDARVCWLNVMTIVANVHNWNRRTVCEISWTIPMQLFVHTSSALKSGNCHSLYEYSRFHYRNVLHGNWFIGSHINRYGRMYLFMLLSLTLILYLWRLQYGITSTRCDNCRAPHHLLGEWNKWPSIVKMRFAWHLPLTISGGYDCQNV